LRRNYESEKRKILQAYEKDMIDYKNKKFQLQKELESVYYGLAERSLKQIKSAEEDFLQRQDELKNSVRLFGLNLRFENNTYNCHQRHLNVV
jgi:ERCC4-type nuclease